MIDSFFRGFQPGAILWVQALINDKLLSTGET